LLCPAGRSVPGRGGPERRRRPRPDGTESPDAHEVAHRTRRDIRDERVQDETTLRHPPSSKACRGEESTGCCTAWATWQVPKGDGRVPDAGGPREGG
jgi:hypothetical protein